MIRSLARRTLPWVVGLFIAGAVVQVFLAGLGVFDSPERFQLHSAWGSLIGWLTLVGLVVAIIARGGRRIVGLAALLLLMFAMQSVFVALRTSLPAVAALHPVNGFGIILVAGIELRAALQLARQPRAAVAAPVASPLPDGRVA